MPRYDLVVIGSGPAGPKAAIAAAKIGRHRGDRLLFHRETRQLLGVHVLGQSVTELVHIGGVSDYSRAGSRVRVACASSRFNPTLAETYTSPPSTG